MSPEGHSGQQQPGVLLPLSLPLLGSPRGVGPHSGFSHRFGAENEQNTTEGQASSRKGVPSAAGARALLRERLRLLPARAAAILWRGGHTAPSGLRAATPPAPHPPRLPAAREGDGRSWALPLWDRPRRLDGAGGLGARQHFGAGPGESQNGCSLCRSADRQAHCGAPRAPPPAGSC